MGKGPVGRWGVILEVLTVGGWGGKKFFDHFFPYNFSDFFVIFIILSIQFEIFMGVPPS